MDCNHHSIDKETVLNIIRNMLYEFKLVDMLLETTINIDTLTLLGPDGIMDSLTAMQFITAIEKRFEVDLMEDLNLDCLETSESLAEYIVRHHQSADTSPLSPGIRKPLAVSAVAVGSHMAFDCSFCVTGLFTGVEPVRQVVYALAEAAGTEILSEGYHVFPSTDTWAGVTYFAIVSASHIVAHTWPEHHYIGVDIFTCRGIDEAAITAVLQKETGAESIRSRGMERTAVVN
jgi:S-adenosylmethionine/arginine decarboxylase-like enzyme/acyl carrier protein